MPRTKKHDLLAFLDQVASELGAEYERIQMRVEEDPGTAGDQGEENWATILRGWLPRKFRVVTKGRIIGHDGRVSPQLDVIVLTSAYPKRLLSGKIYLAAGVVAAFECKTTLRKGHLPKVLSNCREVKRLFQARAGTPYRELHSPIVFGLLAHSQAISKRSDRAAAKIREEVSRLDYEIFEHPRQQLDLACISDLGVWRAVKQPFIKVGENAIYAQVVPEAINGVATTTYIGPSDEVANVGIRRNPVAELVAELSTRLAWEHQELRGLADYYRRVGIYGSGGGNVRHWPKTIYSAHVLKEIDAGKLKDHAWWDEWTNYYL